MKITALLKNTKGFTLIELLVVIGILGILAAALVATIDPFEQLNKAQDANNKNTAIEFLNANLRYYTTHAGLPWYTTSSGGTGCNAASGSLSAVSLTSAGILSGCLTDLIKEGELKPAFTTATGILANLYATETGGNITMCFAPKSKSQKRDSNTRFAIDGQTSAVAGCVGGVNNNVALTNCYWCTQ